MTGLLQPQPQPQARILLVDDHAVLRSGLRMFIDNQADMMVVGEAGDGAEAIIKAREIRPDVILLDLNMPGMDGLTALETLKQEVPTAAILILTMHDDVSYLQTALNAGASGYVLKKAADTELLMGIRAVLRGETYIHSAMTKKLLQNVASPSATEAQNQKNDDPWRGLSEREFGVMRLVALGYTNTEIAETLFLSVKTVETYRARGMEKLNLQTRAQLVQSALKHGHLDQE